MLRRLLRIALPAVLAVAASLTASARTVQAATVPGWRIVATLTDGASFDALTATGPANAWTAGTVCTSSSCLGTRLLVRHWNRRAWQVIAVPKAYVNSTEFAGPVSVAAAGSSAWILFAGETKAGQDTTAVLHWTGKGWGKTVMLPASIGAVVAPTATDVWAFGASGSADGPYAAHYNGRTWTAVHVPVGGEAAYATSAKNIWVLGASNPSSGRAVAVMSFNGKVWRAASLPGLVNGPVAPVSIAAVSATDVWATAELLVPGPSVPPILLHWNGRKWAEVTVPYSGFGGALAQDGRGGIWLAIADQGLPAEHSGYLLHYADGKWSRVTAPGDRDETDYPDVLAWIPGTRSLWGTGEEMPTGSSGPNPAVILKDGT